MADPMIDDSENLESQQFAYIDTQGRGHLPIDDEAHVREAIARFGSTEFDSPTAKEEARQRILAAATNLGINIDEASELGQVAKQRRIA